MNYFIIIDANENITAQYSGWDHLPSPWVSISQNQYVAIVPGSTWSGAAVVAPPQPLLSARQRLAQQAQALISEGLTITSTRTPALNATYATDAAALGNMLGVVSYINANGKFPGTSGTLTWYDVAGRPHVFPTVVEFMAFYTVAMDFVMDCQLVANAGVGTLPAVTATIP
jgi:hypothetical protein